MTRKSLVLSIAILGGLLLSLVQPRPARAQTSVPVVHAVLFYWPTGPKCVEVMNNYLNIQPDEVHINQPTHLPAETWVLPPEEEGLLCAPAILGDAARLVHPASGSFDLIGAESLVDAVVWIITRHPMREDELIETLSHFSPGEVIATLAGLEKSGKAQIVEHYGTRFWSASPAYYPALKPKG